MAINKNLIEMYLSNKENKKKYLNKYFFVVKYFSVG